MTSTDQAAFLAAIMANPDSDLERLIYADYLDERGDPRGEFIRVQCELAALIGDGSRCYPCGWPFMMGEGVGCEPENCSFRPSERSSEYAGWHKRQTHFHAFRRRDRELLLAGHNYIQWAKAIPPGFPCSILLNVNPGMAATGEEIGYRFHRGFVSEVFLSWANWLRSFRAILAACPIRNAKDGLVRLTTEPAVYSYYNDSAETKELVVSRERFMRIGPETVALIAADREGWRGLFPQIWPGVRFELP